jgi:formamidopyrimidine-DNA glycosylase
LPELPEVESLTRGIKAELTGHYVTDIRFSRPDIREVIPVTAIRDALLNESVRDVSRRGKYMLIHTIRGSLGVHLGMSGMFVRHTRSDPVKAHTHAIFEIDHEFEYRFIDPRRFGRLFAINPGEIETHPFLKDLGVEPLSPDIDLGEYLFQRSRASARPAKTFLMDSQIVVGVGNIYASESLWRAKIHPLESVNHLTREQTCDLARQIIDVLNEAISSGGTTLKDYRDSQGNEGQFQRKLSVYGREQKPCVVCQTLIQRTVQGGRSTFHCPFCQKQKRRKKALKIRAPRQTLKINSNISNKKI